MRPWIEFAKEAMAQGKGPEEGTVRYLETYFPAFLRMANEIADRATEEANKYLQIHADDFPLQPVEVMIHVMVIRQ